jgi:hypothetical protein
MGHKKLRRIADKLGNAEGMTQKPLFANFSGAQTPQALSMLGSSIK